MQYQQTFRVKPNGSVKGGSAQISVDPEAGEISFDASVVVKPGWLIPAITKRTQGTYKVDPALLLSSRWGTVGNTIAIGDVVFRVTSDGGGGESDVAIAVTGKPMKGTAVVDTTLPNIRIKDLLAWVTVPIVGDLVVEAVPAPLTARALLSSWFHSFREMD